MATIANLVITIDSTSAKSASNDLAALTAASIATEKSVASNQKAIDKIIASLERQAATLGQNTAQVKLYDLTIRGATESELARAGAAEKSISSFKAQQAAMSNAQGIANNTEQMHKFTLATTGAQRELIVLAHEISQGQYSRFGGSLLVLAERTNAMSLIFSATGLAIGAVVAALGGFIYALIKGSHEQEEFNKQMKLTGEYAGVTAGQFEQLAHTMGDEEGKVGKFRDALQAMVASGQFTRKEMEALAPAVVAVAKATGQSAEDVVKDFSKMSKGVANYAEERNKQMHFMTLAEYERIEAMEKAGNVQGAEIEVGRLFTNQLQEQQKVMGFWAFAWTETINQFKADWESLKGLMKDSTPEEKLIEATKRLNDLKNEQTDPKNLQQQRESLRLIAQAQKEVDALTTETTTKQAAAQKKSDNEVAQQLAINAHRKLDDLHLQFDAQARLNKELDDYKRLVEQVAKVNPNDPTISAARQAADIAGIRAKYDKQSNQAETERERQIKATQAAYDNLYDSLEKQIIKEEEHSKFSEVAFEIERGNLKLLDEAHKNRLLQLANEIDIINMLKEAEKDFSKQLDEDNKKSIEAFNDAQGKSLNDQFDVLSKNMQKFADQAARGIQRSLADFLFDPFKEGLDGMLKGFLTMLQRMAAEAAASQIMQAIASATAGSANPYVAAVGSIFGGGKASGGPTKGGTMYQVAEQGPELYREGGKTYLLSSNDGHVTPNPTGTTSGTGAGGGTVNVMVNIDSSGANVQSDKPALQQFGNEIGKFVEAKYNQLLANDLRQGGRIRQALRA